MTAPTPTTSPGSAVLGRRAVPPAVGEQAITRILSADYERFADQLAGCGYCARPVRLIGHAVTVDRGTGEVLSTYDTVREPDGVAYVRCGNRRAAVCPSCSREYKGDTWHLLAAGCGGGLKGVPATVGSHPQVFVTLTAPSFGPVHTTRSRRDGKPGPCHPAGKGRWLCRHGKPTWCGRTHSEEDRRLGSPLCPDCYDYRTHVVWQWHAPELWRRFTITLHREFASTLGIPAGKLRDHARLSFAKVAEFQRRGVVHFHAIIRLDGPATSEDRYPPPAVPVDAAQLGQLVRAAAGRVQLETAPTHPGDVVRRLRFGRQLDVRRVHPDAVRDGEEQAAELCPERVAAYIAKYATKACEDFGIPPGITGPATARRLGVAEHPLRIIQTAADIARDGGEPYAGLGRWLHMLGFRGHFATKSRRYSVTLGRLRTARRRWQTAQLRNQRRGNAPVIDTGLDDDQDNDSTLVLGDWTFAGIGWLTAGDAALAAESAALAREYADEQRHRRSAAATTLRRPPDRRPVSGPGGVGPGSSTARSRSDAQAPLTGTGRP